MEMRICSPQLGISPYSHLGGTVYDREILKGLARLGVAVEIPLPKGMLHEDVAGWQVHRTPRHLLYYYEYNLIFLPYLFKLWRQPGFDLLRVHSPTIGLATLLFKKVTGAPMVAHYHHLGGKRIPHLINKLVINEYDLITTDSYFCVEQLFSTYRVKKKKIAVVYPGVVSKYYPGPKGIGLEHCLVVVGKRILLYLGSLKPRKNLFFLLNAFAEVRRNEPGVVLIIGGTGAQEDELKAYAHELGLHDSVIFTGYIPEDEKADYYNLADIFVLPSLLEGFGMVAAETMACGKPVVASNTSSLPEVVVDGETGFLADPTCVGDFAEKILRLVRDADLRREMGEKGRAYVLQNFSWDGASRKVLEVYQQVLDELSGEN
jgi:glycosyltransferase involved in cell wall biosynthesis